MKRLGALRILEPHRAKINTANNGLWEHLEGTLSRGECMPSTAQSESEAIKANATGQDLVPIACSWEMCTTGLERASGKNLRDARAASWRTIAGKVSSLELAVPRSGNHFIRNDAVR
jgi:hypothetical protein